MYQKILLIFLILFITECSKKDEISVEPPNIKESYKIYADALEAMNNSEFFFAAKKFSEAEQILPNIEHSAKALIMSSFCYYTINFHEEAISSLFSKKIPCG